MPVQALWFLSFRTWVNAIKRSVSLPRRVFGVVVTLAIIGIGFVMRTIAVIMASQVTTPGRPIRIPLPEGWTEYMRHGAFILHALPFMLIGLACLSVPAVYKKADADVLFATPIPPKVLLILLVLRSQARPLLWGSVSLITYLLQRKPLLDTVDATYLNLSVVGEIGFYLAFSVFLTNLARRTISLSAGLYVGRDGERYEKTREWVSRLAFAMFFTPLAVLALAFYVPGAMDCLLATVRSDTTRWVLAMPAFGEWVATAVPLGRPNLFIASCTGLLLITWFFGTIMLNQAGWLTDIASRSAVIMGVDQAREQLSISQQRELGGKIKKRRWRNWVMKYSLPGMGAIWWRSALTNGFMLGVYGCALLGLILGGFFFPAVKAGSIIGPLVSMAVFSSTAATSPIGQILLRIDLVRALPFPTRKLILAEIGCRAIPFAVTASVANLAWTAIGRYPLERGLAAVPAILALVAIWNTESALVFTLLPDVNDKTQTQVRMLAALAVKILALGTFFGLGAGLNYLTHNLVLTSWIISPLAILGCWFALGRIASMFDHINPAE
ncbi:MAG: putative ABC exporter domain-containing protein [Fimbriimonas sp.]